MLDKLRQFAGERLSNSKRNPTFFRTVATAILVFMSLYKTSVKKRKQKRKESLKFLD